MAEETPATKKESTPAYAAAYAIVSKLTNSHGTVAREMINRDDLDTVTTRYPSLKKVLQESGAKEILEKDTRGLYIKESSSTLILEHLTTHFQTLDEKRANRIATDVIHAIPDPLYAKVEAAAKSIADEIEGEIKTPTEGKTISALEISAYKQKPGAKFTESVENAFSDVAKSYGTGSARRDKFEHALAKGIHTKVKELKDADNILAEFEAKPHGFIISPSGNIVETSAQIGNSTVTIGINKNDPSQPPYLAFSTKLTSYNRNPDSSVPDQATQDANKIATAIESLNTNPAKSTGDKTHLSQPEIDRYSALVPEGLKKVVETAYAKTPKDTIQETTASPGSSEVAPTSKDVKAAKTDDFALNLANELRGLELKEAAGKNLPADKRIKAPESQAK